MCLDGTLIHTDRVATRAEAGHQLRSSGKHKTQGANVQIVADPTGFPVWSSPVKPGSVHDLTAAAPTASAPSTPPPRPGYPPWLTRATTAPTPASIPRSRDATWPSPTPATTPLLTALRALGERANADLKERWSCLRRIRLCPHRIGDIVAATIVLSTPQRGNY